MVVAIAMWPFVAGAASAERAKKEEEGLAPDDTQVPLSNPANLITQVPLSNPADLINRRDLIRSIQKAIVIYYATKYLPFEPRLRLQGYLA